MYDYIIEPYDYLHNIIIMDKRKYTVIDLFAGCGGLSLGLYQAGWNGVFAVEKNPCAFETLNYNLIENKNHFDWPEWLPKEPLDIIEVNKRYRKELKHLRGAIDLVAGGPPCQGFSMAGKRMEDDVRNQLVFAYIDFIKMVRPQILLFENVKGFTYAFDKKDNPDAAPYSVVVVDQLKKLGYDVSAHVIDFSEYGVPQRRKRFILVGIQKSLEKNAGDFFAGLQNNRKSFLSERGLSKDTTITDAISDLLRENGTVPTPDRKNFLSGVYGAAATPYQTYMRQDVEDFVPQSHSFARHGVGKLACFKKLLAEYPVKGKRIDGKAREVWGIKQRGIYILDGQAVAPTITNMPDDYLHYQEPRIMTVRECARIQSFPDWYEFKSKYTTGGDQRKKEVPRYSQVGNAIPPLFAHQAGLVLKEMI